MPRLANADEWGFGGGLDQMTWRFGGASVHLVGW